MEQLIIRELRPEDAKTLIAYTKQIGGESDNLTFGADGFPVTVEKEREILQSMHDDSHSAMLGVWCGDDLIADGSLNRLPRRMSHRAELGMTVKKAYWNQGIGSMLMEHLIQHAKSNGLELIYLEVRYDNAAAIHLYEKYGFRQTGTLPAYFKIGDTYIDFISMCLDLRNQL